jgi:hypothetical protein
VIARSVMCSLRCAVLLVVFLAACVRPRSGRLFESPLPQERTTLPIAPLDSLLRLRYRRNSGLVDAVRLVVRDSMTWRAIAPRLARVPDHHPALNVDFDREMIIIAAMGFRPTGGYRVTVDSVYLSQNVLYAVVTQHSPGDKCGWLAEHTAPADAVRAPRSDQPVLFVERARAYVC